MRVDSQYLFQYRYQCMLIIIQAEFLKLSICFTCWQVVIGKHMVIKVGCAYAYP